MPCPHSSWGTADRCSSCIGAAARKVALVTGEVVVDGRPTGRKPDGEMVTQRTREQRRRGGRR
jgi:hypothetical protein